MMECGYPSGETADTDRQGVQYAKDSLFEVMLDVMEFSLDFALIRMPNGQILRQTGGIPMGDPLSPGMTIGSCAWMEQEWLKTIDASDRKYFRAKQSMDDIAIVYADTPQWDFERFIEDFTHSRSAIRSR